MIKRLRNMGPGLLVAAAFIGPGTVTTASVVGASTGYALLWALVFSIFATIVLQEMSARLGVVSREGLGEALRTTFDNPLFKVVAVLLVVAAIAFGNAAFETGNIIGASLGLQAILGLSTQVWAVIIGIGAFALLASGAYRVIERALVALVIVMSIVFLVTAIMVRPNVGDFLGGVFTPSIPPGSLVTVIALIGTTVVPYNLFLHASSVQEKWPESVPTRQALAESRTDTILAIILGGLITLAIVSTAAAAFFGSGAQIESAGQMAEQLEPLLGPAAKYFFALGLLAAGLTSAITAPLAAAYATSGALGWERNLRSRPFQAVWAIIIIVGTIFAVVGTSPVAAIVFAQAANGVLLPVVAVFLLIVMNRSDLLREYRNGTVANILGAVVVLIVAGFGIFQILRALGVIST
ncbi:MAG: manganese transporter [Actinobacteria bacterium]|nr:Nramp family divalent metal transporter [Actinomycetota bacterium]PLS85427.1 MAG: manganese transporter [Actinomycetota bacterium]